MKNPSLLEVFPIYGYEAPFLIAKERGCYCIPLEIILPEIFTLTSKEYEQLNQLFATIISILGHDTLIHKQDLFLECHYAIDKKRIERDWFETEDELHFKNRPYLEHRCYLGLHRVPKKHYRSNPLTVNSYLAKTKIGAFEKPVPKDYCDSKALEQFRTKVLAVNTLINDSGIIESRLVDFEDLFGDRGYYTSYLEATYGDPKGSDVNFENNSLYIGAKKAQFHTLENLDQFTSESIFDYCNYGKFNSENQKFPVGNLFSLGFKVPYEHVINQYIYIPTTEIGISHLRKRAKWLHRYASDRKGDKNTVYRNQIQDFEQQLIENHQELVYYHLNVLGFSSTEEEFGLMCNSIQTAFKKIGVNAKANTIDRKNLWYGGILGNGIGISSELYSPVSSSMASALLYSEGGFRNPVHGLHGLRMVDRATQKPILVSVYKEPERKHWIFNRGMLVASGSGGGKTYFANSYLFAEFREGADVIILENGNSYDKLTNYVEGVLIEHDENHPFTFSPFSLDDNDFAIQDGMLKISEHKMSQLVALLYLLLGEKNDRESQGINSLLCQTIFEKLINSYYQDNFKKKVNHHNFSTFYKHIKLRLSVLLKEHGIDRSLIDAHAMLLVLSNYAKDGPKAYLLNGEDKRVQKLRDERWIYFKLGNLINNSQLFPIVAFLLMDVFDKKLKDPKRLGINKILNVDEAWNLFDNPIMAQYLNAQSRMARKYGGQPIFISQKVDDFIQSKHLGKSLVVNSHIKVLLDMAEYSNSFGEIQKVLGLNDKQKQLVLSLNKNLPEDYTYREMAICWKEKVQVFGLETSLSTKCLFETNPNEKVLINTLFQDTDEDWEQTAENYKHKKLKSK